MRSDVLSEDTTNDMNDSSRRGLMQIAFARVRMMAQNVPEMVVNEDESGRVRVDVFGGSRRASTDDLGRDRDNDINVMI